MSQLQDATRPVLSLSIFSTNITDLREDSGSVRGEWCISICYFQNFRIIGGRDLTLALRIRMKGIPESGYYMKLVMIMKAEICLLIGRTNSV